MPRGGRRVWLPGASGLVHCLEGKSDAQRFKSLGWGLRAWDLWYFNDLDHRFGDDWPGQIPAQLVGHTLHYFSKIGDLVFDPMAGGGVVPDMCLTFGRKGWSFDLVDRPDTRPEIEPFQWDPERLLWPVKGSGKKYLEFYKELFPLIREHTKTNGRIAFLNSDRKSVPC